MNEKYINTVDCEKFFYEHLDDNGVIGALNAIEEMPAADVEPVKHGRWVYDGCGNLICSNCKWKFSDELPYMSRNLGAKTKEIIGYCMHCGAKMDLKDKGINNNNKNAEKWRHFELTT